MGHGQQQASKRVKGTIIKRPFIYGSSATWLGPQQERKKAAVADSAHTHRWTVYVRGVNNEDLSPFIRRVTFNLHSSFEKPKRTIEKPPFAVTETGWGEFEIVIQILLAAPSEKTFEVFHLLKLFAGDDAPLSKKPVVSEHYDEVVFNDPSEQLYRRLHRSVLPDATVIAPPPGAEGPSQLSELRQLTQLTSAHHKVRREISQLLQQLSDLTSEEHALLATISALSSPAFPSTPLSSSSTISSLLSPSSSSNLSSSNLSSSNLSSSNLLSSSSTNSLSSSSTLPSTTRSLSSSSLSTSPSSSSISTVSSEFV